MSIRLITGKLKFLIGIVRRSKKIGPHNTIYELQKYYKRYKNLPLSKYNSTSIKYNLYIIYTYIKLVYFLYDKDRDNILDFVPRRFQTFLLPIINPIEKKDVLVDKIKFYQILKKNNLPHPEIFFYVNDSKAIDLENKEITNLSIYDDKEMYVKIRDGSSGKGAEVINYHSKNILLRNNCIYQERLYTANSLKELADVESFNTCRVSSYVDNKGAISVELAYLKLGGKGNVVDNIASGGIGIPININTGELEKIGFIEFGTSFEVYEHPYGTKKFEGFFVPEWEEIKKNVLEAHNVFKELRHISWDIGLTEKGPIFVEGNSGGDIFANQLVGNKRYYHHKLISDTFRI